MGRSSLNTYTHQCTSIRNKRKQETLYSLQLLIRPPSEVFFCISKPGLMKGNCKNTYLNSGIICQLPHRFRAFYNLCLFGFTDLSRRSSLTQQPDSQPLGKHNLQLQGEENPFIEQTWKQCQNQHKFYGSITQALMNNHTKISKK